jgi:hypothetical protein
MLTIRTMYLMTALLLGLAALEPSSAESQEKRSTHEQAVPFASAQDYWSASRHSVQVANEHARNHETAAACEELAKSLDYYRLALAKETDTPRSEFGTGLGDDEGMRDIRARFGCPGVTAYGTPAHLG